MQNARRFICAGSIFLLLLCFLFFPWLEDPEADRDASFVPMELEVGKGDKTCRIMLSQGERDHSYYAFLPSGTDTGHARLISIGGGQN